MPLLLRGVNKNKHKINFPLILQLVKHHRSHERRGEVPGVPPAPPSRRSARSAVIGLPQVEEEAKTLVCDICAGVFHSERALSTHLNAHKQDTVCGIEGCQDIFRSARALKEHKVAEKYR